MAPLNVEVAEKYLGAIPLLSLSDEPIRIPAFGYGLERQSSRDSYTTEFSSCSKDILKASLNTHRAERFLTSLQLDDHVQRLSLAMPQARDAPQRQWSETEGSARYESIDNIRTDMYGQVVSRSRLRGGCFTLSGRQPTPPSIESASGCVLDASQAHRKDQRGHGPLARAMHAMGWTPFAQRKQKWSRVEGTSYASYLVPAEPGVYDPDFLNDHDLHPEECQPEVSVIPFVRPRGLKEELNEQFRQSHPGIHPSITLSKLRNLQKDLREITTVIPVLDISTVALAWVYFEKLVLGDFVRKPNRKLLAGACLVLAFKFNQNVDRTLLSQLAVCIRNLDRKDRLNLPALHDAELKVFVWLEFCLHVEQKDYAPHLHRLLKGLGTDALEYYGPGTESSWLLYDGCSLVEEAACRSPAPSPASNPPASSAANTPASPSSARRSWGRFSDG